MHCFKNLQTRQIHGAAWAIRNAWFGSAHDRSPASPDIEESILLSRKYLIDMEFRSSLFSSERLYYYSCNRGFHYAPWTCMGSDMTIGGAYKIPTKFLILLIALYAIPTPARAWCVLNDSVLPLAIFGETSAQSTKQQIEILRTEIKCREQKKNETMQDDFYRYNFFGLDNDWAQSRTLDDLLLVFSSKLSL